MRTTIRAGAACSILLTALAAFGQKAPVKPVAKLPAPQQYGCLRAEKAPVIDGKLDDAVWANVPWTSDFVDIEGDIRPKPRFRTRVKMCWDDKALYIAAELEEPHVWANLTEHDAVIFHDPDFEVFIDPDGDNHNYGELELNARNTTWDLLLTKPYRDAGRALNGWEIIGLKTAVQVQGTMNNPKDTDRGWTVEIAWPWAGLNELSHRMFPPADGDTIRINFSRVEWDFTIDGDRYVKVPKRPEHNWVWSPQSAIDMHRPERWGYLKFSTKTTGSAEPFGATHQEARDLLHAFYYQQKAHQLNNGKFARNLQELPVGRELGDRLDFIPTRFGWEASMVAGEWWGRRRLTIREDSRITIHVEK